MSTLPDVVVAIIEKDGKFLLGKRSQNESHAAGYWAAIGGGVNSGETFENALIREVMEEVGLIVSPTSSMTSRINAFSKVSPELTPPPMAAQYPAAWLSFWLRLPSKNLPSFSMMATTTSGRVLIGKTHRFFA